MKGTVRKFVYRPEGTGYAFIVPDAAGPDAWISEGSLRACGVGIVKPGDRLEYEVKTLLDGRVRAMNVSRDETGFVSEPPPQ